MQHKWTTLKAFFAQCFDFFAPSDSRFSSTCISAKYCQTIHQWKAYLFRFQTMYTSQFKTIEPCDWLCGPGSHIWN